MTLLKQYTIGAKLGQGSFGELRLGFDKKTGKHVAVKLELNSNANKYRSLPKEHSIYRELNLIGHARPNFTSCLYYGDCKTAPMTALVLELLGTSLEQARVQCERFSPKTVSYIGHNLLDG